MRSRLLFYVFLFFVGLVLQFGLSQYVSLWGLAPNIILIFVIFLALNDGPLVGQWMGFFWGISWDAMAASMFGSKALALVVIGYLTGMLSRKLDETKISSQATIVLIASFFYISALWALYQIFSPDKVSLQFNYITLLQPFYNVLLAPVMFAAGRALNAGTHRDE